MKREYTHTPLEVAEGILSGKYTITSVYVQVNQIEDLTRERDEALAEVERLREALKIAAGYVRYCHDAWHETRDLAEAWRDLTKIRAVLNDERAGELEGKP